MPQLTTLQQRSTVAGSMAIAVALHGVELADVAHLNLARLETDAADHEGSHSAWEGEGSSLQFVFARSQGIPNHVRQV